MVEHYIGKVETLTIWKNKDGYFFEALGKEWFGRGTPFFQAGQTIEWDGGENHIKKAQLAEHITQPKDRDAFKPFDSNSVDVIRLSCISAAVELVKGDQSIPFDIRATRIIDTARRLERYAKDG